MTTMSAALPQPPPSPQPSTGPKVVDLVVADLVVRAETGLRKYGTYLRPVNGRNALVDAYQEALDLAMYLRQRIQEDIPLDQQLDEAVRTDRQRCAAWALGSTPGLNEHAIAARILDGSPPWHLERDRDP